MNKFIRNVLKYGGYPAYIAFKHIQRNYRIKHPMKTADYLLYKATGKHINWSNPQDLNEKINWLKFHENPHKWARLADKYTVREYVKERGLEDILVPLYGKWDTSQAVLDAWDGLPDEFVLKSNNGSGRKLIIDKKNGGKRAINLKKLKIMLDHWLAEKDYGLTLAEFHYQFISNCVIAEKLLQDKSSEGLNAGPIDYRIWSFNGKPFMCFIAFCEDIERKHTLARNIYDMTWQKHDEMFHTPCSIDFPQPINWEKMVDVAAILSKGHPVVRIDLYNIDGTVYFGEMTFTGASGYMDYWSSLGGLEMGKHVELNLTMPWNNLIGKDLKNNYEEHHI